MIRRLEAADAEARRGELSPPLRDAILGGASIGFVLPLAPAAPDADWRDALEAVFPVARRRARPCPRRHAAADLPFRVPRRPRVRLSARGHGLEAYLRLLADEAPGAPWLVAGLALDIRRLIPAPVAAGGHVRVGLEDAPLGTDTPNVKWVEQAAAAIENAGGRASKPRAASGLSSGDRPGDALAPAIQPFRTPGSSPGLSG